MNSGKLLAEISTPSGKLIKVGESYTNVHGVELEIKRISRPDNDVDILVEFMPRDATLADKWWWGMYLPEGGVQSASKPLA